MWTKKPISEGHDGAERDSTHQTCDDPFSDEGGRPAVESPGGLIFGRGCRHRVAIPCLTIMIRHFLSYVTGIIVSSSIAMLSKCFVNSGKLLAVAAD